MLRCHTALPYIPSSFLHHLTFMICVRLLEPVRFGVSYADTSHSLYSVPSRGAGFSALALSPCTIFIPYCTVVSLLSALSFRCFSMFSSSLSQLRKQKVTRRKERGRKVFIQKQFAFHPHACGIPAVAIHKPYIVAERLLSAQCPV